MPDCSYQSEHFTRRFIVVPNRQDDPHPRVTAIPPSCWRSFGRTLDLLRSDARPQTETAKPNCLSDRRDAKLRPWTISGFQEITSKSPLSSFSRAAVTRLLMEIVGVSAVFGVCPLALNPGVLCAAWPRTSPPGLTQGTDR